MSNARAVEALDNHEIIERTQLLMHRVFGRPRTLAAVASAIGISRSRVRQIERRAFLHLGNRLLSEITK